MKKLIFMLFQLLAFVLAAIGGLSAILIGSVLLEKKQENKKDS